MKKIKNSLRILALISISVFVVSSLGGEETTKFLKGKVYSIDKPNLSLEKKLELAQKEFKSLKEGEYFFAGYSFLSRNKVTIHSDDRILTESYRVKNKDGEIVISKPNRRKSKTLSLSDEEKGKKEAGIFFLYKISGNKGKVTDFDIIDLDDSYEFKENPVYWLGQAKTEESIRFLEGLFDSGDYRIQKKSVFVISLHNSPRTYDFLKRAAVGNYKNKLRKNAIFWLGNYKDSKSLDYLKEIFKKEENTDVKNHIVFALSLSDMREAVVEMIQIAKTESIKKVRKNAIFWLGQKASKESVKALKDVVDESEDVDVKKHAVFSISQLPKDKAVPMLIDIAKSNKSSAVRKNAIFWLGQVGDEEALKFFKEILLKK
ncbi:MAG: HEAT repeat domain-containing protein [Candidatus Aminicenantaceae bacterium]